MLFFPPPSGEDFRRFFLPLPFFPGPFCKLDARDALYHAGFSPLQPASDEHARPVFPFFSRVFLPVTFGMGLCIGELICILEIPFQAAPPCEWVFVGVFFFFFCFGVGLWVWGGFFFGVFPFPRSSRVRWRRGFSIFLDSPLLFSRDSSARTGEGFSFFSQTRQFVGFRVLFSL